LTTDGGAFAYASTKKRTKDRRFTILAAGTFDISVLEMGYDAESKEQTWRFAQRRDTHLGAMTLTEDPEYLVANIRNRKVSNLERSARGAAVEGSRRGRQA